MKSVLTALVVVLAAAAGAKSAKDEAGGKPPATPQLLLELTDGSRIVGTPALDQVKLQSDTIKVDLKLDLVRTIEFGQEHRQAQVKLSNGDRLSGQLSPANLDLNTSFGKVTVPLALVRRMDIRTGAGAALDGLILHYAFERLVDGEVSDETGNNPPAKLHGCKITPAGKKGSGLLFGDEGGYAAFSDKNMPAGNSPRSVVLWFKASEQPHPQCLFGYGRLTSRSQFAVLIYEGSSNLTLGEQGNRHPSGVGRQPVTDGVWHHLVVVYDGNRTVTGYVDGQLDFSATRHYATEPSLPGETAGFSSTNADYAFKGTLDEFMVFNKALTAEEVKNIYVMQK